jgi:hypothetical protein
MRVSLFLLVFLVAIKSSGQVCEYSTEAPRAPFRGHELLSLKHPAVSAIDGIVVDGSGAPVADATVILSKAEKMDWTFIGGAYTDQKGRFCFGAPPDGKYRIEFGGPGFNSVEVFVTVSRRVIGSKKLKIDLPVGT